MGDVIDGRAVAAKVREEVAGCAAKLRARGVVPTLAVAIVGDDEPSHIYVRSKERACERAGIRSQIHRLPESTSQAALLDLVASLNADDGVHGILVQLPLPRHIRAQVVIDAVDPQKDVDGFHVVNAGHLVTDRTGLAPCTPAGVMRLLSEYDVSLLGAHAVVVGRSRVVGRPMAAMLLAAGATVTICHRYTPDSRPLAKLGDVVIVAVGKAHFVDSSWIKEGAVVVDVGIHRGAEGLRGDVHFDDVIEKARLVTPVPGGVGPMTIALLLENTCKAAARIAGLELSDVQPDGHDG